MPRQRRQGIIYDIRERGTARLVFDEKRTRFEGVLETVSGETMFLKGKIPDDIATTSDGNITTMNVDVVDGEEGSVFHVTGVEVRVDNQTASIESAAVKFDSEDRIIGMKAAVEIRQHLTPDQAEDYNELFIGNMQIHLLTSHRPPTTTRRESICGENNDIKILETSDDFLA
ncbi:unnamed protein product [Caenorhabditis angaria]|uniref:Uncharacterized protein n=1 Tax=Caenorhabditis angaria TaxID=860376 RepID=A0A9P1N8R2_9PELO|nr:unnamed protein product [Caenorhabditis angaria]